jgi:hypothetical protein
LGWANNFRNSQPKLYPLSMLQLVFAPFHNSISVVYQPSSKDKLDMRLAHLISFSKIY